MDTPAHRIQEIIDYLGVSNRAFELEIGKSNGYIKSQIRKTGDISSYTISTIINKYPQFNLIWIMTGKGDMLLNGEEKKKLSIDKIIEKKVEEIVDKRILDMDLERTLLLLARKTVEQEIKRVQEALSKSKKSTK